MTGNSLPPEENLYAEILSAHSEFQGSGKDTATWEGLTYVRLLSLLKAGEENLSPAVSNAMLLLLALFPPNSRGVDLWGTDLSQLPALERKQALAAFGDLFVGN